MGDKLEQTKSECDRKKRELTDLLTARTDELKALRIQLDADINAAIKDKSQGDIELQSELNKKLNELLSKNTELAEESQALRKSVADERMIPLIFAFLLAKKGIIISEASDASIIRGGYKDSSKEDKPVFHIRLGDSRVISGFESSATKRLTISNNRGLFSLSLVDDKEYIEHPLLSETYSIAPIIFYPGLYQLALARAQITTDGKLIAPLGEYFQTVPSKKLQAKLKKELVAYYNGKGKKKTSLIRETGRKYCYYIKGNTKLFAPEYEYEGKRYVLLDSSPFENGICLSNNAKIKRGEQIFVQVEPVWWYIDTDAEILISMRGLIAGIPHESLINFYHNQLLFDIFDGVLTSPRDYPAEDTESLLDELDKEMDLLSDRVNERIHGEIDLSIKTLAFIMKADGLVSDDPKKLIRKENK